MKRAIPSAAAPAASTAEAATDEYISEDEALDAALKDAGVAKADATEIEVELDRDDATKHFDVEFKANGMEYDYDIDPVTGDVLYGNSEVDDD